MKVRNIPMSAPMVLATLDDTKLQTRRVMNPQPRADQIMPRQWSEVMKHNPHAIYGDGLSWTALDQDGDPHDFRCPYGMPGDRLRVREAWSAPLAYELTPPRDIPPGTPIVYLADGTGSLPHINAGRYRPAMFMPKWASRITLEVTGVRVERLQDISEADALVEGVNVHPDHHGKPRTSIHSPVQAYRDLWEQINGPDTWALNPCVWVIDFKRVKP